MLSTRLGLFHHILEVNIVHLNSDICTFLLIDMTYPWHCVWLVQPHHLTAKRCYHAWLNCCSVNASVCNTTFSTKVFDCTWTGLVSLFIYLFSKTTVSYVAFHKYLRGFRHLHWCAFWSSNWKLCKTPTTCPVLTKPVTPQTILEITPIVLQKRQLHVKHQT